MIPLIDTHCHIDSQQFDADFDAVLQRAEAAGVEHIFLPNVDMDSIKKVLQLAQEYPGFILPMIGIHPTEIGDDYLSDLSIIHQYLSRQVFVAVGEIGVDLYWDKTYKKQQMLAFEKQVEMALAFHLPVNIHVRDAFNEVFEVLERFESEPVHGIFHCFSGSKEIAERIFRLGDFYLGIGGVLTFKNAKLGEVIKHIGLERIVLETDAPYLAPTPFRGKRNESAYLVNIVEHLSTLLSMSVEKVAELTTQNARNVYKCPLQ